MGDPDASMIARACFAIQHLCSHLQLIVMIGASLVLSNSIDSRRDTCGDLLHVGLVRRPSPSEGMVTCMQHL